MATTRLKELAVEGKRVLCRVDFNVPMQGGAITDDTRIRAALPTLNAILERGGTPVLMSHLGRPKGQVVDALRMKPVAERLAERLGRPVEVASESVGAVAEAAASSSSWPSPTALSTWSVNAWNASTPISWTCASRLRR